MPMLSRPRTKLLRTVAGKPHASDDDHEDAKPPATRTRTNGQLATPASSADSARTNVTGFKRPALEDEDIYADPVSSDEDGLKLPTVPKSELLSSSPPDTKLGFKSHAQLDGPHEAQGTSGFKVPTTASPPLSAASKRSVEHASSDSDDFALFNSQASHFKKPKTSYSANLFAKPQFSKPKAAYGSKVQRQRSRDEERKAAELKRVKKLEEENAKKKPGAGFRLAKVPDMFEFSGNAGTEPAFKQPVGRSSDPSLDYVGGASPDLSDLSDVPVDLEEQDVVALDLPAAGLYVRKTECAICSEEVPYNVREDFEDRLPNSKQWTYKWQQRFCIYHRKASALQLWEERMYPEIEWDGLPNRLCSRRHTKHVDAVLGGKARSMFRKQLEERVKGGRNKTAGQLFHKKEDAEATPASTGYYGPRGEKVMTDHILAAFSDELRTQAAKDKLIAASGVAGGVSGFVQAVLVPELALSLIREDLGPKSKRDAIDVLAESAELGELLHPELEDRVKIAEERRNDDDDDDDGIDE